MIESSDRILSSFDKDLSKKALDSLRKIGVEIILGSKAQTIDENGVVVNGERIYSKTVIWAAGVGANKLNEKIEASKDESGKIIVSEDLSILENRNIFVIGDQSRVQKKGANNKLKNYPGVAPVAIQMGKFVASTIIDDIKSMSDGKKSKRKKFKYFDKGMMATIGRSRAILQSGPIKMSGFIAWLGWVVVHVASLLSFRNKISVLIQWLWSYFKFGKVAPIIMKRKWKFF